MNKLLALALVWLSFNTQAQFSNESEASVVVTGGNAETEVYNAKTTNQYVLNKNKFTLGGHYMYGTSFDVESSRNWDVNTKYERALTKTIGAFVGVIVEGDEFAGIDRRTNVDVGASYTYLDTDNYKIFSEGGYRYRREKSISGNTLSQSQGRFYVEAQKKKKGDFSSKVWVEYLPNFTDGEDWQVNFEPSIQYNFLNNLALKWGYLGKYDNEPVLGNKKFDFLYTTSLIAKF